MRISIKGVFKKDTDRVNDVDLLIALQSKIEQIERAKSIEYITGVKLLRGYRTHYRIYVHTEKNSYRVGAIIRGQLVTLVRFLPRRIIYKQFP